MSTENESSTQALSQDERESLSITTMSGLMVDISDSIWTISPRKGKGQYVDVGWIYSSNIPMPDRALMLVVFVHYVCTRAAATASCVVMNVKPCLSAGIPTLHRLKILWSGLQTNHKKGLNQFFGTLSRLAYDQFDAYHVFTSAHLDKEKNNALDISKGALTEIEFDSLAKRVNDDVQAFDWRISRQVEFYRAGKVFGAIRNKVAKKLLLSIVRRPIQLAALKWSDLIPAGQSFNDPGIRSYDELGTIGGKTLQLRVYFAKIGGARNFRDYPEHYPMHLSEKLSDLLRSYKRLVFSGIKQILDLSRVSLKQSELLNIMDNVPIFPDADLFRISVLSLDDFKLLFTDGSMGYHVSESNFTESIRSLKVVSDRVSDCVVSSNRIRHTVLTRGAQDGLSAIQLAKITGVTVPAARHYVDLDYASRRMIDARYAGNDLLVHAFSGLVKPVGDVDDTILDVNFAPIGALRHSETCLTCSTSMGKPLGCYGCPNFCPIIEADHRTVLEQAKQKLDINRKSLVNPLHTRSIEKLEKQIVWVQLTIDLCDETLRGERSLDA